MAAQCRGQSALPCPMACPGLQFVASLAAAGVFVQWGSHAAERFEHSWP